MRTKNAIGMPGHWDSHARDYPYVGDMTLEETCETVVEIMDTIGWQGA